MAVASNSKLFDWLAQLPHAPASDVKKLGWRGLMRTIRSEGKLVVTNHDEPEAVILSTDEYADLMRAAQQTAMQTENALAALRQRFDQRLAVLQSPDAADRLRDVMRAGARLKGKVKAGARH
ncbi:MAG: type II toxin-antitoxin system Phd/YefM family antitoxin [Betaproteobacteria bacterium]|nr:type II toxin-antitoxin system Phd/YefM family antitoxin [Betaproteobacteria bacterium]